MANRSKCLFKVLIALAQNKVLMDEGLTLYSFTALRWLSIDILQYKYYQQPT